MVENSKKIDESICWIETVGFEKATSELRDNYEAVNLVHGKIHNLYRAFSLQPKPMISADRHYREILHNSENKTEPWFLELLATQTAILAECEYAYTHHGADFAALLGDQNRADEILQALRNGDLDNPSIFTPKQTAILRFGEKLCLHPEQMKQEDIDGLHQAGVQDTEILESVQATACFAYWVRFINALGIQLGDEHK